MAWYFGLIPQIIAGLVRNECKVSGHLQVLPRGRARTIAESWRRLKEEVRITKADPPSPRLRRDRRRRRTPRRVAELVFWAIVGGLRSQKYEGGKSASGAR